MFREYIISTVHATRFLLSYSKSTTFPRTEMETLKRQAQPSKIQTVLGSQIHGETSKNSEHFHILSIRQIFEFYYKTFEI